MVNEALNACHSGTCLRAIKPPFTKRISSLGVDDSNPRKAVSDLLRFLAAIVAGGVNDFGGSHDRSGSRQALMQAWERGQDGLSVERFGAIRAGWSTAPGENR
jgi:hypothetical protein